MQKAILSSVLLAMSIAYTGCSSGADGEGSGGGSGSTAPLSFDAQTSLPAAGGAAAVVEFAAQFGNTISSIVAALGNASAAASSGVTPKINVSDVICTGGGSADLTGELVEGKEVTLDLVDCMGSSFGAGSVSGKITLKINPGTSFDPLAGGAIYATAVVVLEFSPGGMLTGGFDAFADVARDFKINLRLGDQLDSDLLTLSDGGQVFQLGCFEIHQRVSQFPPGWVAPLGVANLDGLIYTINDYGASSSPRIDFDSNRVPSKGEMTLHGGDGRTGLCGMVGGTAPGPEEISSVTATFSSGGCIDLQGENKDGPFENSTTWDKLLARDFTSGSGPGCDGDLPATCGEVPATAVVISDSDFQDSNWEVEIVATEGADYDAPIVRQPEGGFADSAFRQMTHTIRNENATCAPSCTLGAVHKIIQMVVEGETVAATYIPRAQGAIAHIDYTEAQRVIESDSVEGAVGWAFAVVQDGTRYNGPAQTAFTETDWTTNGICGLTAEDFGPADGPHPDFGATGTELTFAYIRSTSNTSDVATSRKVHGIDNFQVVIVKEGLP